MTLEQEFREDTVEKPVDATSEMEKRGKSIENKMGAHVKSVETLIATLPEKERGPYMNMLTEGFRKATARLGTVAAAATVAFAMSSPAFAQEQSKDIDISQDSMATMTANTGIVIEAVAHLLKVKAAETGMDISTVTGTESTMSQRIDAGIHVLTKPPLVAAILEKKLPMLPVLDDINKIRNEITLRSQLDQDDPSIKKTATELLKERVASIGDENTTTQKKVDASLEVATDTPILSTVILKKLPIISLLYTLNELQKDIQNPKMSKEATAKKLGRALLDAKTLGLGSVIIDILSGSEPTQIAQAPSEDNRQVISQ